MESSGEHFTKKSELTKSLWQQKLRDDDDRRSLTRPGRPLHSSELRTFEIDNQPSVTRPLKRFMKI